MAGEGYGDLSWRGRKNTQVQKHKEVPWNHESGAAFAVQESR